MIDVYVILSGIILLSMYGLYSINKTSDEKTHIIESKLESISQQKTHVEDKNIEEVKLEPVYQLQTHKIKYWLYSPSYDFETYSLRCLYQDVVVKNLWLNEPFHSKFFEILIVLDKNEFMILDPNSRVITMNIRGENNQITTSKSFQVFATKDIIEATLKNTICDIVRFNKYDAQHIVIAICIIALEQSLHYQSKEVSKNLIESLLIDYEHAEDTYYVITLLKDQEEQLKFVGNAFQVAFQTSCTQAYNDSEVSKSLKLPTKLPQKVLKEV